MDPEHLDYHDWLEKDPIFLTKFVFINLEPIQIEDLLTCNYSPSSTQPSQNFSSPFQPAIQPPPPMEIMLPITKSMGKEPMDDTGPQSDDSPKGPNIINRASASFIISQAGSCSIKLVFRPLNKLTKLVFANKQSKFQNYEQKLLNLTKGASKLQDLLRFFFHFAEINKKIPWLFSAFEEQYNQRKERVQNNKQILLGKTFILLQKVIDNDYDLLEIWSVAKHPSLLEDCNQLDGYIPKKTRQSASRSQTEELISKQQMLQRQNRLKTVVNRKDRFQKLEEKVPSLKREAKDFIKFATEA